MASLHIIIIIAYISYIVENFGRLFDKNNVDRRCLRSKKVPSTVVLQSKWNFPKYSSVKKIWYIKINPIRSILTNGFNKSNLVVHIDIQICSTKWLTRLVQTDKIFLFISSTNLWDSKIGQKTIQQNIRNNVKAGNKSPFISAWMCSNNWNERQLLPPTHIGWMLNICKTHSHVRPNNTWKKMWLL